jgi:hypothetical protein
MPCKNTYSFVYTVFDSPRPRQGVATTLFKKERGKQPSPQLALLILKSNSE